MLCEATTRILVGSGRFPPSDANMRSNTGTMKMTTAAPIRSENASTITGYVIAPLILARRFASASYMVAMRASAPSRKPPVSPALIMLTMSGGKTSGCRPSAVDNVTPPCTSIRTRESAFFRAGFVAWSSRIDSDRRSESPDDVIDANWREKTARSFSFTFPPRPGILSSRCRPLPDGVTDSGISFCAARVCCAASIESDSRVPLTCLPA